MSLFDVSINRAARSESYERGDQGEQSELIQNGRIDSIIFAKEV
jgi:hypothetical protein